MCADWPKYPPIVIDIKCVLEGYTRCAAKIPEACLCMKMSLDEYVKRYEEAVNRELRRSKSDGNDT